MALPFFAPLKYSGQDGVYFSLRDNLDQFLSLSATTDITYTAPMTVTTQPVQTGQTITDNLQEQPKTIQISGVVVVGYVGSGLFGLLLSRQSDFVTDFMDTVETWRSQRQVLTVIAKDGLKLQECVITNFSAKKDKEIANGLRIDITFQEIDFRVQLGRTSDVSQKAPQGTTGSNGNGAKAVKGSVTKKLEKGATAITKSQGQIICDGLNQQNNMAKNDPDPKMQLTPQQKGVLGGCLTGTANIAKQVTTYDESGIPNNYKNTVGNINKKATP